MKALRLHASMLLLLASSAGAGELPALPEDPAASAAMVREAWLPELQARQRSGEERVEVRTAYFRGEASLDAAFVQLQHTELLDPAALSARLHALDQALEERVRERRAIPTLADTRLGTRLDSQYERTLDVEDEADFLARRLIVARLGFVNDHEVWAREGAALRAPLLAELDELRERLQTDPDPETAQRGRRIDDELGSIKRWASVLADTAARPVDLPPIDTLLADSWDHHKLARLRAIETAAPGTLPDLDSVEIAFIEGIALPAASASIALPDDPAAALPEATARSEEAARRASQAPTGEPGTVEAARYALTQAQAATASAHLEAVLAAVPSDSGTEAERAREQAERARAEAEIARDRAEDARAVAAAEVRANAAQAQEQAAAAWERARVLEEELKGSLEERKTAHDAYSKSAADARTVGLDEPVDPDVVYAGIRELIAALRADALSIGETKRQLVQEQASLAAQHRENADAITAAARIDPPLADDWEQAGQDEARALEAALTSADQTLDDVMTQLGLTKSLRRELASSVSSAERARDQANLLADAAKELSLLGPNLFAQVRARAAALVSLPSRLTDLGFLLAMVRGSFLTLFLSTLWWLGRRRTEGMVKEILRRIRQRAPTTRPSELRTLRAPMEAVLTYSIDLAAGYLLREPLAGVAPELGLFVAVWLQIALFRWFMAVFDVLVIAHPERRPSLLVLGATTHALARRSLSLILLWRILSGFTAVIALNLLGADAIAEALGLAFRMAGIALAVWLLYAWHAPLLARVRRLHQGSGPVQFLSVERHAALRVPHALALTLYLAAALAWDVFDRLARRQEGVGRVFNALNRYRLGQDEPTQLGPPLPPDLADRVRSHDHGVLRREAAEAELLEAVEAWKDERRRGLIALAGDRGEGTSELLDHLLPKLAVDGLSPLRLRMEQRIRTKGEALAWLAASLELQGPPEGTADTVDKINALPPRVIVIEDLHLAFLRTVGGFDGLNTLMLALNAASDHHLWIVSVHAPAWRYLTRLGGLVDTGIFRTVVALTPLGEDELRELTRRRLSIAGLTADFAPLVRSNPFGTDPLVEIERTTSVFYRLLAEASHGNPSVALHLFAECLSVDPDDDKVVRVGLRRALAGNVDHLADAELFALTAIRTQARLSLGELVEVTNMASGPVRQIVKNLQSQGLLRHEGDQVIIPGLELPAVTRTLRRRHFLHGAV